MAVTPAGAQVASPERTGLLVSVAELAGRLDDPRLVLIQADRDPAAYAGGHIPGARSVPLRTIVVERNEIPNELPPVAQLDSVLESVGVSNESRIVIYGAGGYTADGSPPQPPRGAATSCSQTGPRPSAHSRA